MIRRLAPIVLIALAGCGPAATTQPPGKTVARGAPPDPAVQAPAVAHASPPVQSAGPAPVGDGQPPAGASVAELDPANLATDATGTLPKTSDSYHYLVSKAVFDEDVLVAPVKSGAVQSGARFFLKDAQAVASHAANAGGQNEETIVLPGVYTVIGTKTTGVGSTFPRLVKVQP